MRAALVVALLLAASAALAEPEVEPPAAETPDEPVVQPEDAAIINDLELLELLDLLQDFESVSSLEETP